AIPSTEAIVIIRGLTIEQQTDLENRGAYNPETLETQLDKIVVVQLQQQEEIDRCLKIQKSEATITSTVVNVDDIYTAGEHLKVSSAGTGFDMSTPATTDGSASDASPADISISAAASGSGANYSRSDHVHTIPVTIPTTSGENTFTESNIWFKGSDVASSATITLLAGNWFDITGTTDITDITTVGAGFFCLLHFDAALVFTHDGDDIICPGGQSITTHAGMEIVLHEHSAGKWRVVGVMDSVAVHRSQAADLTRKVTFFDDFIGTISTPISSTAGSGGQNEAATIAAADGGTVTLKTDDDIDVDTHAAVCTTMSLDTLDWSADQGGLIFETRLKINDVSEAGIFVGFTDAVSTTVEFPIYKTTGADTIDSDATNAVGIGYDIDGTTDEWFHGGVKAGTDTAARHSGTSPSDNTYVTLRVEVDSSGGVVGYIDNTAIGASTASAVTTTTALTPCIVIGNRTATQIIVTIDYFWVQA
ncbi:hypothetical protein LCGC14_2565340, partial [marine sediment metagenome]